MVQFWAMGLFSMQEMVYYYYYMGWPPPPPPHPALCHFGAIILSKIIYCWVIQFQVNFTTKPTNRGKLPTYFRHIFTAKKYWEKGGLKLPYIGGLLKGEWGLIKKGGECNSPPPIFGIFCPKTTILPYFSQTLFSQFLL